jgi:DNA-directed RNA polymerase specialized sigma24 family protein
MTEPLGLVQVLDIGRRAGRSVMSRQRDSRWSDDIEQEAMIGAYRAWCHGLTDQGLIYLTARGHAISFLRVTTKHRVRSKVEIIEPLNQVVEGTEADGRVDVETQVTERHHLDLTDQERQVVGYLAAGYGQRQVGEFLGVTESRVNQILAKIRRRYPEHAVGRHRVRAVAPAIGTSDGSSGHVHTGHRPGPEPEEGSETA